MRSRLVVILLAMVLASLGSVAALRGETQAETTKIAQQVMLETTDGQATSFIIYLEDQPDLSAASAIADEDARGWYVYNTLTRHAARTQAPIKAQLDAQGVAYTPYWGVNMIVAEGDRSIVEEMAARSDVAAIEPNTVVSAIEDEGGPESTDESDAVDVVETGVIQTQAPAVWALGYNGTGIVVANQDTGMRWTHAALRTHYRGWGGDIASSDHNYNWWDSIHTRITNADGGAQSPATNPCGRNLVVPCDDNGHGTHTTGTAVGDDAGAGVGTGVNQVGVAPGAKWIGCRNMDSGNGRASTYTECFQFFLAPHDLGGLNADPTKRPHVVNNSWGCPPVEELCAPNVMKTIVENLDAAGVFVVASAGNAGSACATVNDPPAIYEASFSVGSVSATNALSSFSSRGAVTVDGSGRMKPDISARGASVRSATRTSDIAYGTSSGTSMAGPHVVGTVALLWSARPNLVRDTARTKWLLTRSSSTAVTVGANSTGCGGIGSIPNNHFGWGTVNVLAAYNLEPSLYQAIDFAAIPDRVIEDPDTFTLGATASSGLPVSYAASGSCTVSGDTVNITGVGDCTITASQAGYDQYSIAANAPKPWYAADDVSQTFNIAWSFSGLKPPINGGIDSAKAGSSVPVKFDLNGDQGMAIIAAGYPASRQVDCDTGAPLGALEPTDTAGKSSLSFGDNQYTYIWETQKGWAGTCRELSLLLSDNNEYTALFSFK